MSAASDLAQRLDLAKHTRSWRGTCPACDYPRAFTLKASRDGRPVTFCANGCDAATIADTLARITGTTTRTETPKPDDIAAARLRKQQAALRLWAGSAPALGTLVAVYLRRRCISEITPSASIRFRADTPHPERGRHPAMIALVQDVTGAAVAVHRTYLDRTGAKAAIEPPKASLGPVWGGAIRLDALHPDLPLVLGEGIESAASAGLLTGWPAWAALSAGNLARGLLLPPEARHVAIAVDPDPAGEQAGRTAALRFMAEGRRVQLLRPRAAGDFNDLLMAEGRTDG
ncbi:DUF7146 domain-containing protein [Acidisphaera rubrifaciens]|uniref:Virulence-associated E n=1 Tax=Acidisphaera rubrifaciens HS-AP3 TaxID=1231350 RepID=A0A0D6P3D4_9PROT|nr:toprim domain-containing protein [Acidisphaera rubrifaciens]GAN76270.1 virulence-associated E [Acidisphaera rubrifaciens HS-AP3]